MKYDEDDISSVAFVKLLLVGGMLAGFTRTDCRGENTVDARLKPPWINPMILPLCLGNQVIGIIVQARENYLQGIFMGEILTKHGEIDSKTIEQSVGTGDDGDRDVETEVCENWGQGEERTAQH